MPADGEMHGRTLGPPSSRQKDADATNAVRARPSRTVRPGKQGGESTAVSTGEVAGHSGWRHPGADEAPTPDQLAAQVADDGLDLGMSSGIHRGHLLPVVADLDVNDQGHDQRVGLGHRPADQGHQGRDLRARHLDHQLVVDLEQHLGG